jgi:glyoxylase-like metal-dependent hydrolase (beta-lactamase superfamily II)
MEEICVPRPPIIRELRSAFKAKRLTPNTFLIIEHDDIYRERPYIYARIIPLANTLLLFDTGCGGASNTEVEVLELREFLEVVRVEDNDGRALNEGAKMVYMVLLSHCHYDHIRTSVLIQRMGLS